MEYQKIENFMDSTEDQPSKFRTRNWVKIMLTILNIKLQC